jgi:capsular polysaccharide biosynthesis protein
MSDSAQIHASLRERWWLLGAAVVIGGCGGFVYAHLAPTTYSAAAYVVAKPVATTNQQAAPDPTLAVNFAQAFGRIITQDEVLGPAARSVSYPGADFANHVQATTSPDAPLIKVVGTAGSADQASAYANAVATSLVTFGNLESAQTGVSLASFSQATPPQGPSSPNGTLDIAVGAASGLLVGALATMVRRETRPVEGRNRSRFGAGGRSGDDESRLDDAPYPPIKEFTLDADEPEQPEQSERPERDGFAARSAAWHDADPYGSDRYDSGRFDSARSQVDRYDLDRYSEERYGSERRRGEREEPDDREPATSGSKRFTSDWHSSERYTSSRFSAGSDDEEDVAERERRERERALGDTLITSRVVASEPAASSSATRGSDTSDAADGDERQESASATSTPARSAAKPAATKDTGGKDGQGKRSGSRERGSDGTSADADSGSGSSSGEGRSAGARSGSAKPESRSAQGGGATPKPGPSKGGPGRPARPGPTARSSGSGGSDSVESDPVGVRRGRP